MSDEQWSRIEGLLPAERGRPGRRVSLLNRRFMDALRHLAKTGEPWRDLPPAFGPWKTVYNRFSRWSRIGIFDEILRILSQDADCENLMIDGSFVRAHQHSAGGIGGQKKIKLGFHAADSQPKSMRSSMDLAILCTSIFPQETFTTLAKRQRSSQLHKEGIFSATRATTLMPSEPLCAPRA